MWAKLPPEVVAQVESKEPLTLKLSVLSALLAKDANLGPATLARCKEVPWIRSYAAQLGLCPPGEFTQNTVTAIADLLCIEQGIDQRAAYSMTLDAVAEFLKATATGRRDGQDGGTPAAATPANTDDCRETEGDVQAKQGEQSKGADDAEGEDAAEGAGTGRDQAGTPTLQIGGGRTGDRGRASVGVGPERLLTVREAARAAGCNPGVISNAVTKGNLKGNGMTGRARRIDGADFARWLLARAEKPDSSESYEEVERQAKKHVRD